LASDFPNLRHRHFLVLLLQALRLQATKTVRFRSVRFWGVWALALWVVIRPLRIALRRRRRLRHQRYKSPEKTFIAFILMAELKDLAVVLEPLRLSKLNQRLAGT
jgi:hypothetical protein